MSLPTPRAPLWFWICLAMTLITAFVFNAETSLWDEDEAAYFGFGLRILQTGDWLIPQFTWSDVHRKTPLHFWCVSASMWLFGKNEWALRLPNALFYLGTLGAMWHLGKRIWDDRTAQWSVAILGATLFVPSLSKIALTDTPLLFFQTVAALSLLLQLKAPTPRWNLLLWLSIAGGLLTKGPPILILLGGIWLMLYAFHPQRKNLVRTHPWLWGFVAVLPLAAWVYSSIQRDGGIFASWLLDWYVLRRAEGSVFGQTGPPGYHLLILLISFLPWLPLLPEAIGRFFKALRRREPEAIALLAWLTFGWLFYEVMRSKLPSYSIAAQPAIAILIAYYLSSTELGKPSLGRTIATLIYSLTLIAGACLLPQIIAVRFGSAELLKSLPFELLLGGAAVYNAINLLRKETRFSRVGGLAVGGTAILLGLWLFISPIVEQSPIKAIRPVARYAQSLHRPGLPVCLIFLHQNMEHQQKKVSLPAYLEQQGMSYDIITDEAAALARYYSPEPCLIISGQVFYAKLQAQSAEQGKSLPAAQAFRWWSTDDKLRERNFWVLLNPATVKNQ